MPCRQLTKRTGTRNPCFGTFLMPFLAVSPGKARLWNSAFNRERRYLLEICRGTNLYDYPVNERKKMCVRAIAELFEERSGKW
jgi:hypothetical protein